MTLRPVGNTTALGSSVSNAGGSRWMSQRSLDLVEHGGRCVERLADDVPDLAQGDVADRHADAAAGVLHRGAAGQAVGGLEGHDADPAVADLLGDLTGDEDVGAVEADRPRDRGVDLGQGATGELDVDHRAGDGHDAAFLQAGVPDGALVGFSVTVIWWFSWCRRGSACGAGAGSVPRAGVVGGVELLGEGVGRDEVLEEQVLGAALVVAEGLGAADDLHDLGGDRVLAGPVHDAGELGLELLGVVGRRLHGPLAGGVLGRRGVEERREDAGLDVAGQDLVEDARSATARTRGRPRGRVGVAGVVGLDLERQEASDDGLLGARVDVAGVGEVDRGERARLEPLADGRGDPAGVLVGGLVGDAGEGGVDAVVAEAEVAARPSCPPR